MSRRLDIPLDRDGSARFLPWLIALMVYLAALATSGALVLHQALAAWNRGIAGTLTVEIPAPAETGAPRGDAVTAAVGVLKATPGITAATPLDRAQTLKLIAPWLGSEIASADLPLPQLIDVRTAADAPIDFAALRAHLAAAAPGAELDNHRALLARLKGLAVAVEATALVIVALIFGAAVLSVIFTTRAGLAMHREVIEILHLMGARDRYIAGQFQREALRLGLTGGVLGLVLAVLTLLGLGHVSSASAALGGRLTLLPTVSLAPWHWAALVLLPLAAALVAMVTARVTVLGALSRMP